MNCVIPGQNLKIIGKAIHALAKIGDELYLQASEDDLTIRTYNMSKTCFAIYKFMPQFFTHYTVDPDTNVTTEGEGLKCKLPMKGILSVFKSPQQMEKQIELCKIDLQPNATKIIFKFRYKHDINRTQSVWLIEGESLQVVYKNPDNPNIITSQASLYTQALSNFQMSDDEVSLDVTPQKIIIRNYIENEIKQKNHVRSQLSLNPTEFDIYKIGTETNISFSIKPFRSAINFAEYFNLNITLSFQTSGKPVVIIIQNAIFEANFMLATVDSESNTQSTSAPSLLISKTEENHNLSQPDKEALETINWDRDFEVNEDRNEEMDLTPDDLVVIPDSPESPRSKRIKIVFKRCFEPTLTSQMNEVVLAENSDTES